MVKRRQRERGAKLLILRIISRTKQVLAHTRSNRAQGNKPQRRLEASSHICEKGP